MTARRWDDRPPTKRPRFNLAKLCALVALVLGVATAAEAGPIVLAWDPVPDPTVIGYVVLYGTAEGIYTGTLDAGNQTSATVRGLADGQAYYFAVQAYSAAGRLSSFSNVVPGVAANQPPHITNPGPQAGAEGALVALALAGSDPDADPLAYTATGLPPTLSLDLTTGMISGTIAYDAAGTHVVTVTVNDGAASSSAEFQWVVTETNQPPAVIVPDLSHGAGAVISYAIPATEPDGTLMTFDATGLPPGLTLDPNAGIITGTLTNAGVYPVTLTVTDESSSPTTVQFQWTVLASNTPPTLTAPGNQEGSLVNPTSLQLVASDPDGNTLTYSATGLPPGLVLDAHAGTIVGQPTAAGVYAPVTVQVSDGITSVNRTFTWTIFANRAPTIQGLVNQSTLVNGLVDFIVQATDPEGTELTFSAVGLPSGLVLDANTGAITGAPTQIGGRTVTIFVSDGTLSASQPFSWTILANGAPTLQNPGNQIFEEYRSLEFTVSGSDPDGNPVTFDAVGLPPGLWIDTDTGTVSGLPTRVGTYVVTLTVSDGAASASETSEWVIFPNPAPTIENPGAQTAVVGTPVFLPINANDPNGHPFTLTASGLPPGLTLDQTLMLILGTPTTAGTYSDAQITAFDGTRFTSVSFTWTVTAGPAPFTAVQWNQSAPGGTPLTVTVPYAAPQLAGSLNVVAIGWHDATATIASVTDSRGRSYELAVGPTVVTGVATQSIYYAANIVAAVAGENVVQVTFTGPATSPDVRIVEYAGVRAVTPVAGTAAAEGNSGLSDSGFVTTVHPTVLLVAANLVEAGTTTTAAGETFTSRVISSQGSILEDRTVTALGGYNATAPLAPDSAWIMQLVAFRAVNTPPSLGPVSNQSHPENAFVAVWLAGVDPDGDALTYDAFDLPDGLGVTNEIGLIAGDLTFNTAGVHTVTATVSDGEITTSRTFTWTVTNVNRPPTLIDVPDRTDLENTVIAIQLEGADQDADSTLTYSAATLPAGITLNAVTGLIAGKLTYASAGTHLVTVTATDAALATGSQTFTWTVMNRTTRGDFDGDGKTDLAVYRPSDGTWSIRHSQTNGATSLAVASGVRLGRPVTGDYDGDAKADVAVYHSATGVWTILNSSTNYTTRLTWGASTDVPVPDDYDGDFKTDLAVYRPATGQWQIRQSSTGAATSVTLGLSTDLPAPGDYDGDGKADLAIYRPATGQWQIRFSSTGSIVLVTRGGSTDLPVPADYDGDGKTDVAVYHSATGQWQIVPSGTGLPTSGALAGTTSTDVPVPGDYDGDGKTDRAVYQTTSVWRIRQSDSASDVAITWGPGVDVPVVRTDFDGDGLTDIAVFRPSDGSWNLRSAGPGTTASVQWGNGNDKLVPGDYDGDGKTDIAVFRPSDGIWYLRFSSSGTAAGFQWGSGADMPVHGDYNGDRKADIAVFRPSNGTWYLRYSGTGAIVGVQWGNGADKPVPGDYDGDGKTDIAVFRPSDGTWYLRYSKTGATAGFQWGNGLDVPVPGDYDGDGKTDVAVFRPSNGTWYFRYSATGTTAGFQWGNGLDVPVPGDYDGDGKTDIAVFRPSEGVWYLHYSRTGATAGFQWGNGSPIPVLKRP